MSILMKFGGNTLKHSVKNTLPYNMIYIKNKIIDLNKIQYVEFTTAWNIYYLRLSNKIDGYICINENNNKEEHDKISYWLQHIKKI